MYAAAASISIPTTSGHVLASVYVVVVLVESINFETRLVLVESYAMNTTLATTHTQHALDIALGTSIYV